MTLFVQERRHYVSLAAACDAIPAVDEKGQ